MKQLASHAEDVAGEFDAAPSPRVRQPLVSGVTFWLYIYFLVDFYLHLSARIPGYGKIRPTLLLVAIIAVMLWSQQGVLRRRGTSPVFRSLLILIGYLVVSLPLVQYPGSVLRANLPNFVKAIAFFYFTAFIIDSPKRFRIFLFVFVFSQLFRVLEPLYMNLTSGYWGSATHLGGGEFADRLSGAPSDVVNPNGLGFVIVTTIPYLHYLIFPRGLRGRLFYICVLPLSLYALVLTMSRGAFIALIVVGVAIFRDSKHKLILVVAMIGLVTAAWSVMTPIQKDRYLSLVGQSDTENARTAQGRFDGMIREFRVGLSRPVVGHGLGTASETKYHALGDTHVSHNLYAELFIEIGLIGSGIFLYFLYSVYRSLALLRRLLERAGAGRNSFATRLVKALTTVFFMYSVYSINYWGLSQPYWYLFGGLVFAFYRQVVLHLSPDAAAAGPSPGVVAGANRRGGMST